MRKRVREGKHKKLRSSGGANENRTEANLAGDSSFRGQINAQKVEVQEIWDNEFGIYLSQIGWMRSKDEDKNEK